MLHEKEVTIDGKEFILKKFPAIAGREIVTQYPLSATPKLGDYQTNENLMLKIMAYVGVKAASGPTLWLTTKDLVNNHITSWETLVKVEYAAMEYNISFLQNGKILDYLSGMSEALPDWITKILTGLSDLSSAKEKQPSKSFKKTIA